MQKTLKYLQNVQMQKSVEPEKKNHLTLHISSWALYDIINSKIWSHCVKDTQAQHYSFPSVEAILNQIIHSGES